MSKSMKAALIMGAVMASGFASAPVEVQAQQTEPPPRPAPEPKPEAPKEPESRFARLDSSCLDKVCRPVEHGEDVLELITGMVKVLRDSRDGVGLAANQVGDDRRVIVINTQHMSRAIINPVITKRCCGQVRSLEGCLSFSQQGKVTVMRDKQVTLEGFTYDWKPVKMKLRGLEARVAQHEVDHLDAQTVFPMYKKDA